MNKLTLEQWTNEVDAICESQLGLGIFDILGDFMSHNMWSEGLTPSEAFNDLYENDILPEYGGLLEIK